MNDLREAVLELIDKAGGVRIPEDSASSTEIEVARKLRKNVPAVIPTLERLRDEKVITWTRTEIQRYVVKTRAMRGRFAPQEITRVSQRIVEYVRNRGGRLYDANGQLVRLLQRELAVSGVKTINRELQRLEDGGVISRVRTTGRAGGTTLIELNPADFDALDPQAHAVRRKMLEELLTFDVTTRRQIVNELLEVCA